MRADREPRLVVLNWRDRRHPGAGAAELYCERVARELAARGRSVVLVTSRPEGTQARERTDGYDVRRLGGWWSVYPLALLWLLKNRSSVGAVVDSQNGIPFFSPLVVRRPVPVVLLVHHVHQDLFARALNPLGARLARWLEGPASRRVYRQRTVVVLSPSARAQVRRRLRFDGAIRVVPAGADSLGLPPARSLVPRVVVVGRLSPFKRLEWLIDAMAEVQAQQPDVELHLVGDGPARTELELRARAAGAPVVFHGRLSDADRDEVLRTAWLTVSASDGGDWAMSLIEANGAGVPAVARRVDGMTDAVRHGTTGWLVDGPAQELGASIAQALDVLADPEIAQDMAARTRRWAGRFTWERTAESLDKAVVSEEARLQRQLAGVGERRSGNDLMVVLSVPETAIRDGWESSRRAGDVWVVEGHTVRALLTGADEADVQAILGRLAVDVDDPGVSVLVARHADVLGHPASGPSDIVDAAEAVGRPVELRTTTRQGQQRVA